MRPIKIFYCVRPDFFHHNHIHRRKVDALRRVGINTELISFVSSSNWHKYKLEYQSAYDLYDTRVIRIPSGRIGRLIAPWIYKLFFIWQLILYRQILVQCLLCEPELLYNLRNLKIWTKHLKIVIEYEGDLPSESLYMATVDKDGGPLEVPPEEFKATYESTLQRQYFEIDNSDGLIVVSKEHLKLLEKRWLRKFNYFIYPTLFDSTLCQFQPDKRHRTRAILGIKDEVIMVHLGGAKYPWHRFAELCLFIKSLVQKNNNIRLLGLIRKTELVYAKKLVKDTGIEQITQLLYVPAEEVKNYLSAADVGLFLRHNHTMTNIVSSAKLGEYIACGLPVVSTGAHTFYNRFMEQEKLIVPIQESLELDELFNIHFKRVLNISNNIELRTKISDKAIYEFNLNYNPNVGYVDFCNNLFL